MSNGILEEALRKLRIECSESRVKAFSLYLHMLRKWSRAYNLTSIVEERDIILKHFIDSLSYLEAVPEGAKTLLDIGTGAGFPGVPMKIARPDLKVFLIEPSRKKTAFLKNLIKTISLRDIYVIRCRLEDYPCGHKNVPEKFDIIVTRALYKVDEFLRRASPFCNENGLMIISKGPSCPEEMKCINDGKYNIFRPGLSEFGLDRHMVVIRH